MATATKITTREDEPSEQEFKRCECGCDQIVNSKRHFAPGHDQRHRGNLLRRFDSGDERAAVELVERGWRSNDELQERADKREKIAQEKAERASNRDKVKAVEAAKPKREIQASRTAAAGRRLANGKAREAAVAEGVS